MPDTRGLAEETADIWNENADFWDARMGEGNAFHRLLVEPAQLKLLRLFPGEQVLDIACGNGQFARKLASLGARVTAVDAAPNMIANAKRRTPDSAYYARDVSFAVADACDQDALTALGVRRFDAAVCAMALMDIPTITPLANAVHQLLTPAGRLVFTVMHPCFNSAEDTTKTIEQEYRDGDFIERLSVKTSRYITPHAHKGVAMRGQPLPQNYFHRPLSALLSVFLKRGFALDAIEEPTFPRDAADAPNPNIGDGPLSWLRYTEIPPVLAVRMRLVPPR